MSDENNGGNGGNGGGVSWAEYNRTRDQAVRRKRAIAEKDKAIADLTKQLDDLKGQVGTLTTERDDWKKKHDELPSALKADNDKLRGTIRQRDHRDAIGKLGEIEIDDEKGGKRKVKLKGDVLDDLLTLTGYKPEEHEAEGGTPDAERIRGFFADAVKSRPWAIETAGQSAETPRPGPGGGRGNPAPREGEIERKNDAAYDSRQTGSGAWRIGG